jgi:hypothetical protein
MVRVRTERCHGFTTLTIVLVTASFPALQRRRLQIVLGQSKAARANPCETIRWNSVWCQGRALVSRYCAVLPGAYNLGRYRETQV